MKTNNKKVFAIVCSGGNAPGMANCVNIFNKRCLSEGIKPIAFANGFEGIHDNKQVELNPKWTQLAVNDGSAFIGTSRCPEFAISAKYRKECAEVLKKNKVECLVVVGGEGSYKGAYELSKLGINVLTIPATIDNDVASTSYTIGFDSCLNKVCDVIADINDVFISHKGVAIIELMGRSCPDVTIRSAIANNTTYMVTKYSMLKDAKAFLDVVNKGFKKGKYFLTFLVTEKMYGRNGLPSLNDIARAIEHETGLMCRHIEVGYVQRGGKPSARDRLLANYMMNIGLTAILSGKKNRTVVRNDRTTRDIPLTQAMKAKRKSWNKALVEQFNKINQE